MKKYLIIFLFVLLGLYWLQLQLVFEQPAIEQIEQYEQEIKFDLKYQGIINKLLVLGANQSQAKLIYSIGTKYGIDPLLLGQIIKSESRFDSMAINLSSAKGLLQITDSTERLYIKQYGKVYRPFNVESNLDFGCYILAEKLVYYGSIEKMLASYHGGHKRAKLWGNVGFDFGKTKYYVNHIILNYNKM